MAGESGKNRSRIAGFRAAVQRPGWRLSAAVAIAIALLMAFTPGMSSAVSPVAHSGTDKVDVKSGKVAAAARLGEVDGELFANGGSNEGLAAYVPAYHELFVPDGTAGVTVLNTTTNQPITVNQNVSDAVSAAYDPGTGLVYVSDAGYETVDIINPATPDQITFFATGPYGGGPILYDPTTGDLWVGDAVFGGIFSLDPLTGESNYIICCGVGSVSFAYDASTDYLYAAYEVSGGDWLLAYDDLSGYRITDYSNQGLAFVTVDAAAGEIVVANQTNLTYFDQTNQSDFGIGNPSATYTLPPGGIVAGLAYDPVSQAVYVLRSGVPQGTIDVVSDLGASPQMVAWIVTGENPGNLTYDPDNQNLYVSGSFDLLILGAASYTLASQSFVPTWHNYECCEEAIIYVPTSKTLYVLTSNDSQSIIGVYAAGGTHKLVHTVLAGAFGQSLLYDPLTNAVLVWNWGNETLTVINAATYATSTVPVYAQGYSMAYDPVHATIGLAANQQGNITVLDARTYSIRANLTVGGNPTGITYDAASQTFVTGNGAGLNFSVVRGTTLVKEVNVTWYYTNGVTGITYDPSAGELVLQFWNSWGVDLASSHTYKNIRWVATGGTYGLSPNFQAWATMAYDPADQDLYVEGYNFGGAFVQPGYPVPVIVLNDRGQVVAEMAGTLYPNWPQSAAYDPVTHQMATTAYTEISFVGA